MMRHWDLIRFALGGCLSAAFLAGCSAAPTVVAPTVVAPTVVAPTVVAQTAVTLDSASWMLPDAHSSTLIYAGGFYGGVYIYNYDTGKAMGELKIPSDGMCVDTKGDVYVTQMSGTTLEYAHGGTKVLKTFTSSGVPAGCSLDASNDLAVTSASPADVTVFAGGDPSKGTTYSDTVCQSIVRMGYDKAGNLMGLGGNAEYNAVCALLAGSQSESTLSMQGFTIYADGGTMWDGKYITFTDQNAQRDANTGVVAASLSGSTLDSHGETILTDPCSGGPADVGAPFFVGAKNPPVNDRRAKVAVGINSVCTAYGTYRIDFWHYPKGGNPFKFYKTKVPEGGPVVSIGH